MGYTLISFIIVIGILVFIHELGHFLAARAFGVGVMTFSLGFGPKILKKTEESMTVHTLILKNN